jgi:hypothetical protein
MAAAPDVESILRRLLFLLAVALPLLVRCESTQLAGPRMPSNSAPSHRIARREHDHLHRWQVYAHRACRLTHAGHGAGAKLLIANAYDAVWSPYGIRNAFVSTRAC